MEHLFVVTYGKSGSTLLMGLLNSLPGYRIMGENAGALLPLMRYHDHMRAARDKWREQGPLSSSHPWFGMDDYPTDLAVERLRDLVTDTILRPQPDTRVTGFKEIRWWQRHPSQYLDFLDTLYPGARYILNTRDKRIVATRSWWKKQENAYETLVSLEADLAKAVDERGDRGFRIDYDEYMADRGILRDLCEWLGEDYDAERFDEVMKIKHTTHQPPASA